MKNYLLINTIRLTFLITFLFNCHFSDAQTFKVDPDTHTQGWTKSNYMIDTVVQSQYSKSQLYSNGIAYIANTFKDSKFVYDSKDSDSGEILFHGNIFKDTITSYVDKKGKTSYREVTFRLFFKCKFYFKDNRFKIILSSLEYPFSELFDLHQNIPLQPDGENRINNVVAKSLALGLIKDMSTKLNKKPDNDF
ncbi:hypothetical protein J3L18_23030 [Mucilaginibacter gossypii]|uniref:hypothetical protein n=1 Tax=Mucilaginibacter gossypii TaxID=551996 RepID=UPI000DCBDC0C|nr:MULTISPECIES: hypothetical protein [Mucilaginibacter]QTE35990.1 hypothetical protein J3L18_23030 [Mucilaginibacter gossypii]RAV56663.1 hypothetical protein DIU36_14780 [Mucilaginibacter rubeus]